MTSLSCARTDGVAAVYGGLCQEYPGSEKATVHETGEQFMLVVSFVCPLCKPNIPNSAVPGLLLS